MLVYVIASFLLLVLGWPVFWWLVTFVVTKGKRQADFLKGTVPSEPPDGFYRGTAYLLGGGPVPWLGKSFVASDNLGFNKFTPPGAALLKLLTPFYRGFRTDENGNTEAYDFKTYVTAGFRDERIETIKLDYDSPENPFLIRIILDEIVEISPNEFLGKVHLKVFPGYYATIGFFGLTK